MEKKNTKLHFAKVERFSNKWVSYKEKSNGKYVKSGDDNQFPQYLIELYNKSSIHAAAINATVEAIIGGGLTSNIDSALDNANSTETWNDIYSKIAMDYYLHGSFALEIIWAVDRTKIAEVYHIDYSTIRAKEKNNKGRIPGYYISDKWGRYNVSQEEIDYLPVYNPLTKDEEPSQIFVPPFFRPGQQFYALPTYQGALKVIELDQAIDDFHLNNISNGLAPSLAITTFTNGSEDDIKAIEESLRANYAGTGNAGSLVYMDVPSADEAPKIEPIPTNQTDSYYTTINDLTTQKILTAHRITSPMMLGIKTEGQLGGRDEVIDAFLLWFNTVIAPLQQDLLRSIDKLLEVNYPGVIIGVETKQLYNDGTVEEEVITSVETTDAEDNLINEQLQDDNSILTIGS